MRSGGDDTNNSGTSNDVYLELRRLSFEDPLAAKRMFLNVLEGDATTLAGVLELASGQGEGRVRQVIARTLQKYDDKDRVLETLAVWRETETDEFALTAITAALDDSVGRKHRVKLPAEMPDLAFTFRYLSGRLRHRILNALPRAGVSLEELRSELLKIGGEELLTRLLPALDDLLTSLRRLDRAVEFNDEEAYFTPSKLVLPDWLKAYSIKYQSEFGQAKISVDFGGADDEASIRASPFLLETVFSNLWNNSRQAVTGAIEISVLGRVQGSRINATVLDNGAGFTQSDVGRAFQLQYSTKAGHDRGRGHMEVADAMRRLGGEASIRRVPGHGFRVVLAFRKVRQ